MGGRSETSETSSEADEAQKDSTRKGSPGLSKIDFVMRIVAAIGTLGSALAMLTTNQSLPLYTQLIRFRALYNDLPTFSFFVVVNAMACAYLVLSLVLSIFHIIKSGVRVTRLVLIIFDTVMLALLTAGASAAAAIVHIAHKGNTRANWSAICRQYNSFCERISGSLVGTFLGVLVLMLLVILSAVAITRS